MNWLPSFLTLLFFRFLGSVSSEQAFFFFTLFLAEPAALYITMSVTSKLLTRYFFFLVCHLEAATLWWPPPNSRHEHPFSAISVESSSTSHHAICSPFIRVTVCDTSRAVQAGGWSAGGLSAPSMRAREAAGLPKPTLPWKPNGPPATLESHQSGLRDSSLSSPASQLPGSSAYEFLM